MRRVRAHVCTFQSDLPFFLSDASDEAGGEQEKAGRGARTRAASKSVTGEEGRGVRAGRDVREGAAAPQGPETRMETRTENRGTPPRAAAQNRAAAPAGLRGQSRGEGADSAAWACRGLGRQAAARDV